MNKQEELLLKRYMSLRGKSASLREVVKSHLVLSLILSIPMFFAAWLIFYHGVREAAYIVLGMWLGMFVTDLRHGTIFVRLWPTIQEYLDWDKIKNVLEDKQHS